ncbi:MAG: glycosyl transferase family 36 [Candidatus Sumerlaeia bacterium]|nr:glycosyl transferase family 36 [Candidatus Sumerlaeia bacterium]
MADHTKYGRFDDAGRRYVITDPRTPRPWVNYATNGRYSRLISHAGGGFSYHISPREGRVTRWRYNALPQDRPGHYLYIRHRDTGEIWNPTWQPCGVLPESWECSHEFNRTRWTAEHRGVRVEKTVFVDLEDDVELWLVRITNTASRQAGLDLFAWVELLLGHALNDLINQPNDKHFSDVHLDRASGALVATRRYWVRARGATVAQENADWDRVVWFASSLPVSHFEGSLDAFIGPWRSESNPIAVERNRLGDTEITAGDPCAALQMPLDLAAGQEAEFAIQLGVAPKQDWRQTVPEKVARFRDIANVRASLEAVRTDAEDYLSGVQVATPDADLNRMANLWHQAQARVTFLHGRDAGYYHGGLLFGRGFRDSCQDLLGPLLTRPQWVRQRLLEMAARQWADGHCYHLYFPGTNTGEDAGHSDTPLWLPLAVVEYVRETADTAVLGEQVGFVEPEAAPAPLLEHVFRALDYVFEKKRSPRGLALFGPGDWNDPLDHCGRGGKGETVWGSMALAYGLRLVAEMLDWLGDARVQGVRARFEEMRRVINEHCWDGAWYLRGTNDLGEKIGSRECREGRIYLNTQSWAVMSGVAPEDRARQAMASAWEQLMTPKGPQILKPSYTGVNPNIGLITRCVPGKKENGAVFNHPVSWSILAAAMLGDGARAHDIYRRALPFNPVVDIDRYEVEPYVQAEYVTSPDHPTFGQASHSWLTGSAVWLLRDAIDWICGVRPAFGGLLVDPCVPPSWERWTVTRRFRGAVYEIAISNPRGLSRGQVRLTLDGAPVEGNLLPPRETGGVHRVEAVLER